MGHRFRVLLLAGGAVASAGTAAAQEMRAVPGTATTAEQARALESGLRSWMLDLLGPRLTADRPVQISPAGDHFDVAVPLTLPGSPDNPMRLTATARPLDGGRWSLDQLRTPSPIRFTAAMPVPPRDGGKGPSRTVPVAYAVTIGSQDGSAILDPSFATPSTWSSTGKAIVAHAAGSGLTQDSTIGASNSVATITPAGPDRVDLRLDGTLTEYRLASVDGPDGPPVQIAIDTARVTASMDGLSRSRATAVTRALAGVVQTVLATPEGAPPPRLAPEVVATVLSALQDFATEMSVDESFKGLSVKAAGYGAVMEGARLGLGARSDKGILQASMTVEATGIALPDLALGGLEALLPRSVSLRPFVSGAGVAELSRMAAAVSQDRDVAEADLRALFSHGGLVAGLESMRVELGGAIFAGSGKATMSDPATATGSAQLSVENFDALFKTVSTTPSLAQAVPAMIFLKGIGRSSGAQLVYDIAYDGAKLLVNDVDLMAMAGGAPKGSPTPKAPARPGPPRQR